MLRKHETTMAWKAGLLSVLIHVLLVGILLFSFNWKAAHTVVSVSEVELWSELPGKNQVTPPATVPKVEPRPEPEIKKVPEPKPVVEPEPKPEPKVEPKLEEPKVDIELENKKKKEIEKKKLEEEKKKAEKKEAEKKKLAIEEKKKEDERKKKLEELQQATREDVLDPNKDAREKAALEKAQQMIDEELGGANKKGSNAASQGIVDEYIAKIQAKVRSRVVKSLCAEGNPEPQFKISLLPNGEFGSAPTLTKSSGNLACDDAVERAIIESEPFPLPSDPDALAKFRNLNLKFRPNAE